MPRRLLESSTLITTTSLFADLRSTTGAVRLLAAGKAAHSMATAAIHRLAGRQVDGVVIVPRYAGSSPDTAAPGPGIDSRLELLTADHPVPTAASEAAGRRALQLAAACEAGDTLLVLISGGASSLMSVPADGVTLDAKRATTSRLLASGADIHSLNGVRKHLSAIKGGRLAAACAGRTIALVISDVVGDDLSVIGSGPTVPDPATYADALATLRRFGGLAVYPVEVVRHLERGAAGEIAETPKPGDARLTRSTTSVLGGRHDAMRGAAAEASRRGYSVHVVGEPTIGEARVAGRTCALSIVDASHPAGTCVIASGETTVRVTGGGLGGRNQEFVLAAAPVLADAHRIVVAASAGTDGIDGPTDAAGAMADDATIARAAGAGLAPPDAFLSANDSHRFFAALGDLIHTGPTGTNVGDLQVFLLA